MLVLARAKDQSIMIGDDVKITIVEVRGNKVRLGIEAPPEVAVHRMEIYLQIQSQKAAQMAQNPPSDNNSNPGAAHKTA